MQINFAVAPKELEAFKKWHAKACKRDPLTADVRFKQMKESEKK